MEKLTREQIHDMLLSYNSTFTRSGIESICEGAPTRLIGEVVNVEDDTFQCRVKCQIDGITRDTNTGTQIEDEDLPWCYASPVMMNMFDAPVVGDFVELDVSKGIYDMRWQHLDSRSEVARQLLADENQNVKIVTYDSVKRYDDSAEEDSVMGIWWTPEKGWNIEYAGSKIEIRKDKSILLHVASETERYGNLHLTKDGKISLGSEDKAKEPAVLGEQNQKEFELVHKTIEDLVTKLDKLMSDLANACSNPYTLPLKPIFMQHAQAVKQPVSQDLNDCKEQLPKLLSAIVTVDSGTSDDGYEE